MSFADVEKCDTQKEQSKGVKENQVDEKKTNNDVDIDFRCFKCGLHEKCQYFGRKPPFVTKQVEFSEDSFVMRDPFSQREAGRANFLLIGGQCGKCSRPVCVECSIFYSKRFCNECCAQHLSEFPPEIGTKIQKKLQQ